MGLQQLLTSLTRQENIARQNTNNSYLENLIKNGWISFSQSLTFSSADSPEYSLTVSGDYHTVIYPGCRMMLTVNSTVGYYIVEQSSYSSSTGLTTITLLSALTNSSPDFPIASGNTISSVYYALPKTNPAGFPTDPKKWQIIYKSNTNQYSTPTNKLFWSPGANISVPIGIWDV